uniref:Calpain catalytic domain-containing protein n=1 Tax=Macrostomum lignano TaxID=282301 RepID=A0A1I8FD10_9PLAT
AAPRADLREQRKFVDPTFPPEASSLDANNRAGSDIEWRRADRGWLVSNPHLVVDGVSGSDSRANAGSNAWFVTASAAPLTFEPGQPAQQPSLPNWTGTRKDYGDDFHPGIFSLLGMAASTRLSLMTCCRRGKGRLGLRAFLRGERVLERSTLRKPTLNYASLSRGRVVDALASFVRGIPEHWDLRKMRQPGAENGINPDSPDDQAQLAKQFYTHLSRRSLILFSLQPDNRTTRMGDWTKESLVYGRGYILTDIQQTKLKDGKTPADANEVPECLVRHWSGPGGWRVTGFARVARSVTLEFKDKIGAGGQ